MVVNERIAQLRALVDKNGIDIYMIPTADFHNSEYVGEHFKARAFMSGFTGSWYLHLYKKTCRIMD